MKRFFSLYICSLLLTSCFYNKMDFHGVAVLPGSSNLPIPQIKVEGSSDGVFESLYYDSSQDASNGAVMSTRPGDIERSKEMEPLQKKDRYGFSIEFDRDYSLTGCIGFMDEERNPISQRVDQLLAWQPTNFNILCTFGASVGVDVSQGYFDVAGIEPPADSRYLVLGLSLTYHHTEGDFENRSTYEVVANFLIVSRAVFIASL